jgi:hypothetical protein
MKSVFISKRELDKLLIQVKIDDYLSMASKTMEIYEMFDEAFAINSDYGKGYQDGFWAAYELDAKYQLARMESLIEKSLA